MKYLVLILFASALFIAIPASAAIPVHENSAVVFDNTASTNPHTGAYTVPAGSNLALVLQIHEAVPDNVDITGITYNGVAMTNAVEISNGNMNIWYLKAPATGANNFEVTCASNCRIHAVASTISGVQQTGDPIDDVQAFDTGAATTIHVIGATSTVADTLIIGGVFNQDDTNVFTADAGQAEIEQSTGTFNTITRRFAYSTKSGDTAGTFLKWTTASTKDSMMTLIVFKPFAAAAEVGGKRRFLVVNQ